VGDTLIFSKGGTGLGFTQNPRAAPQVLVLLCRERAVSRAGEGLDWSVPLVVNERDSNELERANVRLK